MEWKRGIDTPKDRRILVMRNGDVSVCTWSNELGGWLCEADGVAAYDHTEEPIVVYGHDYYCDIPSEPK